MKPVLLSVALTALAVVLSRIQRLRIEGEIAVSAVRAAVQLSIVTLVVGAVFESLGYAGLFVLVMYGAATWTAARRLKDVRRGAAIGALSVAAGSLVPLIVLFGFGAYPMDPQYVIPIGGILIGGSMRATTLTGRMAADRIADKVADIEARLSLGVNVRFALRSHLSECIRYAMLPVLDQTKNVGLITLPGAFVGMILGGASPVEAAQVQLTVLFSLMGAETLAATACARLVGRSFAGPGERIVLPQKRKAAP